jgi:hypothetical protein
MVCVIVGIVFLLVGVSGFFMPNMAGAHLTPAHNLIHLLSGIASLYFGIAGRLRSARLFALALGALYLGLSVLGFIFGNTHTATLPTSEVSGAVNAEMFRLIPGVLEFGTMDHVFHLALGAIYLIAGLMTRRHLDPGEIR